MRAVLRWTAVALLGLWLSLAGLAGPALAVNPDEMLANPQLEARARDISKELRCLVCQNESIDDSNADLAKDLRILVRKRLVAGDTDRQVIDFIVSRYGEFVLLKPRLEMRTLLLWAFPFAVLAIGAGFLAFSRRRTAETQRPLTLEEERRLAEILEKRP